MVMELKFMISTIFNQILYISFLGTIAALIILPVKAAAKNRLGIKFQYAVDFIFIIRLLLCVGITTSISIYNYVPSYSSTIMNIPSVVQNNVNPDEVMTTADIIADSSSRNMLGGNIVSDVFYGAEIIWLVVVFAIVAALVFTWLNAVKSISNSKIIQDKEIVRIFEDCRKKAGVSKKILIIESDMVKSPCVYGFMRPKILIPKSLLIGRDSIDFRYIFLHELVHVKKHHIFINYIIFTLSTIHWFNPVIRYGLNKMKDDMEVYCDSEVLGILGEHENEGYGNSLLDLAEISIRAPWLPQMAGIINNKNKLKRRIVMIKKFKNSTYNKLSVIALAGIVLIGGSVLTEAKAADTVQGGHPGQIIEDRLDYDFVNDEAVLGKWEAVDFVKNEDDFNAGVKSWKGDLYLKDLIFLADGKMAQPICDGIKSDETTPVEWLTWTNGIVMHAGDRTASSYKIKEINGEKYMIYQWKSGDYTFRGETPWYYVLKQVK